MSAPRTLVEKIVGAHVEDGAGDGVVRCGDAVRLRPSVLLTHDNTAAVLDRFRALGGERVADPDRLFFAIDHDVENDAPESLARFERIRAFAAEQGVRFRPAGEGIGHQLLVEEGLAAPGALCCASDSHANLYGAAGALGVPVVRTDAAGLWLTGRTWWIVPPVVRVELVGAPAGPVVGKDVVLALIGGVAAADVEGRAVEVGGMGLEALRPDDRLAIANLTTEWGAIACVFEVAGGPRADAGAPWERTITLDLATVR
ncbi:MAG: aconitase family protein, partial [Planctomycetota bacterium JB042]